MNLTLRWPLCFAKLLRFAAVLMTLSLHAAPERVTLQLKWKHQWQFAGYYAALEKGYYREAGLEVTLKEAPESGSPAEAVLRGDAEFGVGSSDLVLLRGQGKPVVSLGVIFQHSPLILIALEGRGIRHVHDLAGRRVQFEPGAEELQAYLASEGLPMSAFRVEGRGFDEAALMDGSVDAITAYSTTEPFGLEAAGRSFLTFSPRAAGIDFYGDALFTTEAVLQRSPTTVKAFREASLLGWRYALAHPEEITDLILAKYSQRLSRERLLSEAEQTRHLIRGDVVEVGYQYEGRWHHIAEVYQSLGLLQGDPDLSSFLYRARPGLDLRVMLTVGGALLAALLAGLLALHYRRLTARLKTALEEVNQLSGLIPICAQCKKIRDDGGYWTQVEGYIQARSEATFTHGLCPECQADFFPGSKRAAEKQPPEGPEGTG